MAGSPDTNPPFEASSAERDVVEHARSIAAQWERAASGHVVLAGGCSCGLPAMHVSMADFEIDLLSYMKSKWADREDAAALVDETSGTIAGLIALLGSEPLPPQVVHAMLDDLETAIGSFAPQAGSGTAQRQ